MGGRIDRSVDVTLCELLMQFVYIGIQLSINECDFSALDAGYST